MNQASDPSDTGPWSHLGHDGVAEEPGSGDPLSMPQQHPDEFYREQGRGDRSSHDHGHEKHRIRRKHKHGREREHGREYGREHGREHRREDGHEDGREHERGHERDHDHSDRPHYIAGEQKNHHIEDAIHDLIKTRIAQLQTSTTNSISETRVATPTTMPEAKVTATALPSSFVLGKDKHAILDTNSVSAPPSATSTTQDTGKNTVTSTSVAPTPTIQQITSNIRESIAMTTGSGSLPSAWSDMVKMQHSSATDKTNVVVSTVYAINTMPGAYPNIDYNAIDFSNLGQIGVSPYNAAHHGAVDSTMLWIQCIMLLLISLFLFRD